MARVRVRARARARIRAKVRVRSPTSPPYLPHISPAQVHGASRGAGTAAAPKLPRLPRRPRVDAADRKAIQKMAAAAADAKEQHEQQQAAARAVGERGAPQPFSLVSTLSAQLLPRTPDTGVTPLALKRMPESDFARPGQGPGAPAQQWLREVASEATLRLQPQRQRIDHADVLRPLRSALAVLRTNPNPNPNLTLSLSFTQSQP